MRNVKSALFVTALLALSAATQAPAGVLGPKKPSELVTAYSSSTACPGGGFTGARQVDIQLLSDGTTTGFSIPAGSVFVITNIEFFLESTPSSNISVELGVPCGAGCMQSLVDAIVATDSSILAQGATNLSLTDGIAVKPGIVLCVADVNHGNFARATLHGYLTKDK